MLRQENHFVRRRFYRKEPYSVKGVLDMIRDLVHKNRSYRRFFEDVPIDMADLRDLIDLARLTPSAANKQALRYYLSTSSKMNKVIFPCLSWAGYLKDWTGPAEGERPSAYILLLEKEDHTMLKTILFGFMTNGYISLRELEDCCKVNLRFMYLMRTNFSEIAIPGVKIEIDPQSREEILQSIERKIGRASCRERV